MPHACLSMGCGVLPYCDTRREHCYPVVIFCEGHRYKIIRAVQQSGVSFLWGKVPRGRGGKQTFGELGEAAAIVNNQVLMSKLFFGNSF